MYRTFLNENTNFHLFNFYINESKIKLKFIVSELKRRVHLTEVTLGHRIKAGCIVKKKKGQFCIKMAQTIYFS